MNPIRLAGVALLVVAMSCSDAVGPQRQTTDLEAAHQKWRAQNLHTYAFTLQRTCFCVNIHPLYVAVVNDTVVAVIDFETGAAVDRQFGQTIEDLFTFVQGAIDRPAQKILVQYDAEKGFPREIDYDGAALIADDESFYRISDVHPITPQLGAKVTSSFRTR
ncbi:MAG TPA: DUF6174 domain-containing protein [Gemmatimonadaceae bacterium]